MDARRFVGAVLAPHHAEDAELGVGRLATERFLDPCYFVGRELVLLVERVGEREIAGKAVRRGHREPFLVRAEAYVHRRWPRKGVKKARTCAAPARRERTDEEA